MRARALFVAFALAASLAAGAGAAVAEDGPPSDSGPARHAALCDRAQQRLDHLGTRAGKLADRIAKVEAKIASGDLSDEQLAHAQAVLAKLQDRQTKLADRVDTLSGKIAEHCSAEPTVSD